MQEKRDTAELQAQSKQKKKEIEQAELATKEASDLRDAAVVVIGNYVHDSVPVSSDEVRPSVSRHFMLASHMNRYLRAL